VRLRGGAVTVFFPDVSSYEPDMVIAPGTPAVVAKATEGRYYRDAFYRHFKDEAARVGAAFSAYHFLVAGDGAGQADYCHAMIGAGVPVMLDVEPTSTSRPTVADCKAFVDRFRALGGRVWGNYFPRWYHAEVGGDLGSLGVVLVASGYPGTPYSDADPNWQPYGGGLVGVWQYTDKQLYGGRLVDFNAFRGNRDELAALILGTTPPPSTGGITMGSIPPSIASQDPDLPQIGGMFPAGQPFDDATATIWTDERAAAANIHARQARDAVTALSQLVSADDSAAAGHLQQLGDSVAALAAQVHELASAPLGSVQQIDLDALAAAIALKLPAHLTLTVGAK
jgi:hypothetical protein